MKNSIIIRIYDASVQPYGLKKLVGSTNLASFIDLIEVADLEANPRAAKKSNVTDDIEESLETEGEIFHFMSKGVLIGASKVESLDRDRYRLTFEDPQLEGILDGGHNTLAIGRFILSKILEDGSDVIRSVKRWEDLKQKWADFNDEISAGKKDLPEIRVPIEIVYPGDGENAEEYFQDKILRINAARNNNAQLTEETKAAKQGKYDEIKNALDPILVNEIEWKSNAGGRIKSRDIVALSLIPLSKLPGLPTSQVADIPTVIFAQKGQCVALFNRLLDVEGVAAPIKGQILEIRHAGVKSALRLMRDLPELYDLIYELMPGAYNEISPGFGRISCVRQYAGEEKYRENKKKYLPKKAKTKFYQKEVDYDYPEGFIYPIVFGLTALMEYDPKTKQVQWKTDPRVFVRKNLGKVMQSYYSMIQGQGYDPAKVGKTKGAYSLVVTLFEGAFNEDLIAKLKSAGKL